MQTWWRREPMIDLGSSGGGESVTALALVWLEFAACALPIRVAGPELSRTGEVIADKTGLSGLIRLATVPSLPGLATHIDTAAHLHGS